MCQYIETVQSFSGSERTFTSLPTHTHSHSSTSSPNTTPFITASSLALHPPSTRLACAPRNDSKKQIFKSAGTVVPQFLISVAEGTYTAGQRSAALLHSTPLSPWGPRRVVQHLGSAQLKHFIRRINQTLTRLKIFVSNVFFFFFCFSSFGLCMNYQGLVVDGH